MSHSCLTHPKRELTNYISIISKEHRSKCLVKVNEELIDFIIQWYYITSKKEFIIVCRLTNNQLIREILLREYQREIVACRSLFLKLKYTHNCKCKHARYLHRIEHNYNTALIELLKLTKTE
jgi:NDP-sugar pyrophosphorylase family protein